MDEGSGNAWNQKSTPRKHRDHLFQPNRPTLAPNGPALLFSGSADPVTPPSNATAAAKGFAQHVELVFAGQGHTQLGEPCALGILRRFLQAGSTTDLDTACVAQVRQPPFFLNFNGSAP